MLRRHEGGLRGWDAMTESKSEKRSAAWQDTRNE